MSATPTNWHLRRAVKVLKTGGIIAYPTEAVWGLGCDPLNPFAVSRLLRLKQRDPAKGLILIGSRFDDFLPFLQPVSATTRRKLGRSWPGPVTWLLPARPECPRWLRGGHDCLAVRVSAHPVCQALCRAWGGPLVSTSANISGGAPARTRPRLYRLFNGRLDYIVPGDTGGRSRPSEIRDALSGEILRQG